MTVVQSDVSFLRSSLKQRMTCSDWLSSSYRTLFLSAKPMDLNTHTPDVYPKFREPSPAGYTAGSPHQTPPLFDKCCGINSQKLHLVQTENMVCLNCPKRNHECYGNIFQLTLIFMWIYFKTLISHGHHMSLCVFQIYKPLFFFLKMD